MTGAATTFPSMGIARIRLDTILVKITFTPDLRTRIISRLGGE